MTLYDEIGSDYAVRRRQDPRIAAAVWAALGDARSVVNVGAGAGSYEPHDRRVIAVEPSAVMLAQRPPRRAAAVLGRAEQLPPENGSVEAAMAVLTLHHWSDQRAGLAELTRVARRRVVILTIDPAVSGRMWLMADYAPEIADLDHSLFPRPETIASQLDRGRVETRAVTHLRRDLSDGTWDAQHGHLRHLSEYDAGLRLVTSSSG